MFVLPPLLQVGVALFTILAGAAAFVSALSSAASKRAADAANAEALEARKSQAKSLLDANRIELEKLTAAEVRRDRVRAGKELAKRAIFATELAEWMQEIAKTWSTESRASLTTAVNRGNVRLARKAASHAATQSGVLVIRNFTLFLGSLPDRTKPLSSADEKKYGAQFGRIIPTTDEWRDDPEEWVAAFEAGFPNWILARHILPLGLRR